MSTSKEFLTLVASIVKTWKKANSKDKLPLYDRVKELNNRFNADATLAEKEYTFLFSIIGNDVIGDPSLKWLKRSTTAKIVVGGASMAPVIKTSVDLSDVWNKLHSLDDVISEFDETVAKFKRLFLTLAVEYDKRIAKDTKIKELLSTKAKAEKPTETKDTDAKMPVDMGAMFSSLMPMIVAGIQNLPSFIEQYAEENKGEGGGVMGQVAKMIKEAKIDEALKKLSSSLEGKESFDPMALLAEAKESFDMDAITATAKKNLETSSSNLSAALAARKQEETIKVPQLEAPTE